MTTFRWFGFFLIWLIGWPGVQPKTTITPTATASPVARFLTPLDDAALQGKAEILVQVSSPDAVQAQLEFSYLQDITQTWFPLWQAQAPFKGKIHIGWDTQSISDGEYQLKFTVTLKDGTQEVFLIPQIRVRNYSPIETDTPTPAPTPVPGAPPTLTPTPSPSQTPPAVTGTPFPPNPAEITMHRLTNSILIGIIATLILFLFLGITLAIRKSRKS